MATPKLTLEFLTINDFKLYSTLALKSFLKIRNKATTGSFETLVARAFSAYEEGCEVNVDCEHSERLLLDIYTEKFLSCNLPDPLSLKSGWCGEEEGMRSWPSLYFMDIERYFLKISRQENLCRKLESEYKGGKSYRYYSNNFIGEVFIHNINTDSLFCLFKTKCVPSQRVNTKSYDIWAIIEKDVSVQPGGTIIASYCTCVAGLLGSCSHVAGMLFRIEAAVLSGFTQRTCTEQLAKWNVPSKKKKIEPGKLTNFVVSTDHYRKKVLKKNITQLKFCAQKRLDYVPFCEENKVYLNDKEKTRKTLFNEIKDLIPQSCFAEVMIGKKLSSGINENSVVVDSIKLAVMKFKKSPAFSAKENINLVVEKLVNYLYLSDEQIDNVYKKTILQSKSKDWILYRKCRMTSSNFKQFYTHTKSYLKNPTICTASISNIILGESENVQTFSMKYGIAQEVHAKIKYKRLMKKAHENATFADPGMTIFNTHPFISASPGMEVFCTCHGAGLVEIKCPSSLIFEIPSNKTYSTHLEEIDGIVKLKVNSSYYFQIQGQLGITKKLYCDFFIFSECGFHLERIKFNEVFWLDVLYHLNLFWRKVIAPILLDNNNEDEPDLVIIKKPFSGFIFEGVLEDNCKDHYLIDFNIDIPLENSI
ncbi:uncharacterized protein LOC136083633 [Hydra vulgaris]|uniref:Uncharacterized protein LOC136083633 n=2 Tax=Hydra vulgaris TaxID=6087 RepID=A0ABM4CBY2_HYDVU